ncbi:MAG TPA: peptidoglycan DD-metalloendopeptidase family protein [Longimicrobiales bacterium]
MAKDNRRLTFIVVPHGNLETRTYEISYRWLKVLLVLVFLLVGGFAVMTGSWWFIASQAARVPGLQREVAQLEEERAKVAELARTLAEVEAQYERVRQLLGADAAPAGREPLLPPLRTESRRAAPTAGRTGTPDAWPLTQPGYITQELTDGGESHPGLDIAVAQDSYIRAAAGGVVRDAGVDEIYGKYVLIDHGDGYESMYGHASQTFVVAGDTVERHEVIALSGSTGRSTAPHLHFEVRKEGQAIDPLSLVRQP